MTTIDTTTLDKLLEGVNPADPQSMFSDAGLFGQLKKALAERMLQAELNYHLEQQRGTAMPSRNHKNGSSKKTVLTTETRLALDIPRDRDGSFEHLTSLYVPPLAITQDVRSFEGVRSIIARHVASPP